MTYSNDQIITPEVWGPHGWKFIHYVTLAYPDKPTPEQKEKYKAFLILLKDVLPCSLCANHYGENLRSHPLTDEVLSSKENLIKWGIEIHNIVNESKNKPILKYIDARRIIDTNVQCKAPVKEIINDYEPELDPYSSSYVEKFTEAETLQEIPKAKTEAKTCAIKLGSELNCIKNNITNNINIVYGLIGILVALVFIAVIYKKK